MRRYNLQCCKSRFYECQSELGEFLGTQGRQTAKFDGANLQGAQLYYTGIDKFELGENVKIDPSTVGVKVKVFNFFKTSWTEFLPSPKEIILAPFRWIFQLLRWLFTPFIWLFRGMRNLHPFRKKQRSS